MKFITTLSILLIAASSLAVTGQAHASISGTSQGSTSRSEAIEYGWQPYEVNETADLINCVLLYDYVLEQYPSDKEIRGVAKARLEHLLDHYEYENRPEIYSADYIDSQKILLRNNFVDTTPEDRDRLLAIADQCSHRFANTLESDPFGKPVTDYTGHSQLWRASTFIEWEKLSTQASQQFPFQYSLANLVVWHYLFVKDFWHDSW